MRRATTVLMVLFLVASAEGPTPAVETGTLSGFDIVPLTVGVRGQSAPLEPTYAPATSPAGDVVFLAEDGARERLLLRDPSGFTRAIVALGEPLAGSTVTDLATSANALDAYQQVTFWAALSDGRAGLFRASPPPSLFAISPKTGYRDQPITIQLVGRGFAPGLRVRVGGVDAGFLTIVSPTELTGMLPAGAPLGVADVVVSRPGGRAQTLRGAFEFRARPPSGCRGFWPDHRPPAVTASSVASSWLVPIAILAAPRAWRRLSRRWLRRRRASSRSS